MGGRQPAVASAPARTTPVSIGTRASPGRVEPLARPASVVLVRPPMLVPKLALTAPTCPPVGIAYLASSLRDRGHRVTVLDAVGEAPDQFLPCADPHFLGHGLSAEELAARVPPDTEVIGVSCMFSHEWPITREVLEHLARRCPDALLVVGGEHATALPETVLDGSAPVAVVVRGEGEETLAEVVRWRHRPEVLAGLAGVATRGADGVVVTPARGRIRGIDAIPAPAWDLLPIDTYLDRGHGFGVHRGRSMPIVATRGCPYRCTFCSSPSMWTTRWEPRSPAEVLAEIERYLDERGAENIDFYDLTAIVKRSWVIEFCELVIASGRTFSWQLPSGTRSEALDAEVVGLLRRAGCRNMSYAPESGSPEVLERIKKKVDLDRMKRSMRHAVRAGINCKANIILGLPGETHREVWQTLRFCAEVAVLGLHDLSITPFSPYPGTELFDELRAAGRIPELDDDYYFGLASYSDLTSTVSYSEHIGDRALGRYRFLGMATFYAVSFLCRPWRAIAVARHVLWSDTQESRLEMTLRGHLHRRRAAREGARRAGPAEVPSAQAATVRTGRWFGGRQ